MDKKHSKPNNAEESSKLDFASIVSDFLFRWRKVIFIAIAVLLVAVIGYGVSSALSKRRLQQTARAVYELRQSFEDWKDAHPEDLLTAAKSLEEQGDDALEIDEVSREKAEATEQDLSALLDENASSANENRQAWAYWVQALKAEHLQDRVLMQGALEKLIALGDGTFYDIAQLHLAGLLYSQEKAEEAVAIWQGLSERDEPSPSQIVASIYLANYFARQLGESEANAEANAEIKAKAIGYWNLVLSLGEELLQSNGLDDEDSFLGGENLITGNFRSTFQQWKAMAENQLLFLQSESIKVAANSYDASVVPEKEGQEFEETSEQAPSSVGFDVPALDLLDLQSN